MTFAFASLLPRSHWEHDYYDFKKSEVVIGTRPLTAVPQAMLALQGGNFSITPFFPMVGHFSDEPLLEEVTCLSLPLDCHTRAGDGALWYSTCLVNAKHWVQWFPALTKPQNRTEQTTTGLQRCISCYTNWHCFEVLSFLRRRVLSTLSLGLNSFGYFTILLLFFKKTY